MITVEDSGRRGLKKFTVTDHSFTTVDLPRQIDNSMIAGASSSLKLDSHSQDYQYSESCIEAVALKMYTRFAAVLSIQGNSKDEQTVKVDYQSEPFHLFLPVILDSRSRFEESRLYGGTGSYGLIVVASCEHGNPGVETYIVLLVWGVGDHYERLGISAATRCEWEEGIVETMRWVTLV